MKYNVILKISFRRALKELAEYYRDKNLNYVERLIEKIDKKISCLEIFPEMFQKIPEKNYRNLRYFVCDNYRIVYEIKGDFIYILTIIGGNLLRI